MPIVVVTIAHLRDVEVVREVLTAHTFWHLRGLKVDLVLISEEVPSYDEPLTDHLRRLAEAHAQLTGVDQPGGVFLRSASKMSKEELSVIQSARRQYWWRPAVHFASNWPRRCRSLQSWAFWRPGKQTHEEPSPPLPFMELAYFNGLGGFTLDGKEYAIYLGPNTQTPAPWVNIVANPNFGTLVSESGSGFTWYGNSQSNRLTPWFNDPVSDPAWLREFIFAMTISASSGPLHRCRSASRTLTASDTVRAIRFSNITATAIEQELVVVVPVDSAGGLPVRLERLRLRNLSSQLRKLTITSYAGLVLGPDPEETRMHVATRWDLESQSLFARNPYDSEFCDRTTFVTSSPPPAYFTGDRAAFLGRNRSMRDPAAMKQERLTGDTGCRPGSLRRRPAHARTGTGRIRRK
jgi:cyclic beta-1,2-glucan synthetase